MQDIKDILLWLSEMKELILLILGWLVGIITPGLTSYISDNKKGKAVKGTIMQELEDVKNRLTLVPFYVYSQYGQLNEEVFDWTISQDGFSKKYVDNPIDAEVLKKISEMMGTDSSKSTLIGTLNAGKRDNPGINFKKFSLSVIDANMSNTHLLDNQFLTQLLDIRFQVSVLNEELAIAYNDRNLTFNSDISPENRSIILGNIKSSNIFIAKRARVIVDKINGMKV